MSRFGSDVVALACIAAAAGVAGVATLALASDGNSNRLTADMLGSEVSVSTVHVSTHCSVAANAGPRVVVSLRGTERAIVLAPHGSAEATECVETTVDASAPHVLTFGVHRDADRVREDMDRAREEMERAREEVERVRERVRRVRVVDLDELRATIERAATLEGIESAQLEIEGIDEVVREQLEAQLRSLEVELRERQDQKVRAEVRLRSRRPGGGDGR